MAKACAISNVRFSPSGPVEEATGLLGWVECHLNEALHLGGLAVRRTEDGRLTVSFPTRRDGEGRHHFYLRPLSDRVRKQIERQVLAEVRRQGLVAA